MTSAASEIIREVEASFVEEGKELGVLKGYRVYLLRQLRVRFGSQVDDDTVWRLGEAGSELLIRWTDRVLTEATLDDVLDEPW